ncbi:MAG: Gfo/Idh/MocA family oxidoreductase [Deltaproteobacteria bacterium]|nr:Gfo/Idh/MocA family oxidoreductase [Candidatus Zymogenaceae bacterium]
MASENNKLKVGIIGIGYLGRLHLEKYLSFEDVQVVGIADANAVVIEQMQQKHDIECSTDYRTLLGKVDAVSVVVPTSLHFDIAMDFFKSGADVFVEKPITTTLDQAKRLTETAESKNLLLQVGHLERFNPAILALDGTLKEPLFIESHRLSPFPDRSTDVDVVLDVMIHDIDIILNFVKSPLVHVDAVGAPIITPQMDIVNARLNFESGCVANVTASRVSAGKMRKIRVFQHDAYISIDFAAQNIDLFRRNRDENGRFTIDMEHRDITSRDYLKDEIRSFVDAVKHRSTPLVTGHDGIRALEVAFMIQERLEDTMEKMRERGLLDDGPAS